MRIVTPSRTLVVAATLLLTASVVLPQGKESRGGASRFVAPQSAPDSHGAFAPNFELRTSVVPTAEPPAGIISAQALRVPPKASKEFDRSMKAFQSGKYRDAATHLEKALRIAPDFVQAHNNLGAVYINLRQYESAVAELRKSIELSPDLATPYHNLAMVLILLRRLPEAEDAARHALRLGPQQSAASFTLGRILALQHHNTPEAVQLLTAACSETPQAYLVLAQVLQNRGETPAAIAALRSYLQNPDPAKKTTVESWLAELDQRSSQSASASSLPQHTEP
jgi:tetratricopeptide (TPR) repeat protein